MNIKIENLSFKYVRTNIYVLNNIDLKIKSGTVVLLLGLNGCGKTTLIMNLAGLLNPTEGKIIVDNKNIFDLSVKDRSKYIAYVSQKINNIEDVIIKDYLTFGFTNELKFYERPKDNQIKKVEEYAKKFNITHLLNKKIDEISGGERQIVSICCALLQNTEILLLDEPTSALDLKNQNIVLSILLEVAKTENKTIILSSHNPNHGLYLNGDVALMKDGKIVEFGKAKDIITVDKLKIVYGNNICYSNDLGYREISFKRSI